MRVETGFWGGGAEYRYSDHVGIRIVEEGTRREVVWVTVTNRIEGKAADDVVLVHGQFGLLPRKEEGGKSGLASLSAHLKQVVRASGLPCTSDANIEAFQIRAGDGTVFPSPEEAWKRLVHLAILKLPFLLRGRPEAVRGAPYLPLPSAEAADETDATGDDASSAPADTGGTSALRGIWPLPGGVRQYKETFDELLNWLAEAPRTTADFAEHLLDRYEVRGQSALTGYIRVLTNTGFAVGMNGTLGVTESGLRYLQDRSSRALFEVLHARFQGILATLVIAKECGSATTERTLAALNSLLGTEWKTQNQAFFRRNWILSLGMTERTPDGDVPTPLGLEVLGAHPDEAQTIRDAIEPILLKTAPDNTDPDIDGEEDEEELSGGASTTSTRTDGAPGWGAQRLDLAASHVAPFAQALVLPPSLMAQACAALSAGKHLLLVGPPGTGKTRVAEALCAAASAEGYCTGPLVATASADWTTFETIGGYTLKKDQSLCFRPGVFLRALEERRWLVVDEINRADVDRAFGELMTVLSGVGADTPFVDDNERPVTIGPEPGRSHRVPNTFRVIATMNTWDKTSLFRLSYAAQRRFAMVHLGPPEPAAYANLLHDACARDAMDPPLESAAASVVGRLFSPDGLLACRPIGPAVPLDMVRYMRRRKGGGDGLGEAMTLYLLPQLEGLSDDGARQALRALIEALDGWASKGATREVRARFLDFFPHVAFGPA